MADHQYGIHKVHGNYQRVFNEWSTIEKDIADPLQSAAHYMNVLVTYYLSLTFKLSALIKTTSSRINKFFESILLDNF